MAGTLVTSTITLTMISMISVTLARLTKKRLGSMKHCVVCAPGGELHAHRLSIYSCSASNRVKHLAPSIYPFAAIAGTSRLPWGF